MNRDAETVPARHETPDVAELRRMAEAATPGPWSLTDGDPAMSGQHWTIRRQGVPGIRISGFTYGFNGDAAFIVAAVNALPALLDAAAERDALAAKVERVRELHKSSGDAETQGYTGREYGYISPYCMGEVASDEYGVPWPCETIRALDTTPDTGCES